jgi:hypothetical protein
MESTAKRQSLIGLRLRKKKKSNAVPLHNVGILRVAAIKASHSLINIEPEGTYWLALAANARTHICGPEEQKAAAFISFTFSF